MNLPLLDEQGKPCTVAIADILTIKPTTNGPEFHTADGSYKFPATTKEILDFFGAHGFDKVDRTSIINMGKAMRYDTKHRKVYFSAEPEQSVVYATVSEQNEHKLKHLIKETEEKRGYLSSKFRLGGKPRRTWT